MVWSLDGDTKDGELMRAAATGVTQALTAMRVRQRFAIAAFDRVGLDSSIPGTRLRVRCSKVDP